MCYTVQTSLETEVDQQTTIADGFLIEKAEQQNYFPDDPLLSFQDSVLYGCHLDLTLTELGEFCSNQVYKNMMIFQNMNLLKYIGKFGSSNVNFFSDWVEVESQVDNTESSFDAGTCTFPSSLQLKVFYSKIGTADQAQFSIIKVQWSWTN